MDREILQTLGATRSQCCGVDNRTRIFPARWRSTIPLSCDRISLKEMAVPVLDVSATDPIILSLTTDAVGYAAFSRQSYDRYAMRVRPPFPLSHSRRSSSGR